MVGPGAGRRTRVLPCLSQSPLCILSNRLMICPHSPLACLSNLTYSILLKPSFHLHTHKEPWSTSAKCSAISCFGNILYIMSTIVSEHWHSHLCIVTHGKSLMTSTHITHSESLKTSTHITHSETIKTSTHTTHSKSLKTSTYILLIFIFCNYTEIMVYSWTMVSKSLGIILEQIWYISVWK